MTPKHHPSKFVLELLHDYPSIACLGSLSPDEESPDGLLYCPECGFPLIERFSVKYGMKVYCCTNEPEICDYITNDPASGLPILKCDYCQDGYLIPKKKRKVDKTGNEYVLGCTNYKEDGTGCSRVLDRAIVNKLKKDSYQEIDFSKLPRYQKGPEDEIPEIKKNTEQITRRGTNNVNLADRREMDLKGFDLIVDQAGNTMTDVDLLKSLIKLRKEIANSDKISETRVCSNTALVNLSTYHPSNKAEFIKLYGLSERSYGKYGELLLRRIFELSRKQ